VLNLYSIIFLYFHQFTLNRLSAPRADAACGTPIPHLSVNLRQCEVVATDDASFEVRPAPSPTLTRSESSHDSRRARR